MPQSGITGSTLLLTQYGSLPASSLVDQEFMIWNGAGWSPTTVESRGRHPTISVLLNNGVELMVSLDHEFLVSGGFKTHKKGVKTQLMKRIPARLLKAGKSLAKFKYPVVSIPDKYQEDYDTDAYSQGFYSGDGNQYSVRSYLYEPKYCCKDRLIGEVTQVGDGTGNRMNWNHGPMLSKLMVPINGSLQYRLDWLAGILDSDGSITQDSKSKGLQIVSNDPKFLRDIQQMLFGMGVQSRITLSREERMALLPDGNGGEKEYLCKKTERVLISSPDLLKLVKEGLYCSRLDLSGNHPQMDVRQFVKIERVFAIDTLQEIYSVTEKDKSRITVNGIVTSSS